MSIKREKNNLTFPIDSVIVVEFMICSYQIRKRKSIWKKILQLAVYSKM